MSKQAVIIFGPPGAGKGTQAELLAKRHNFIHFDSGRYFENLLQSPETKKSAELRKQKRFFDSGELMTPSFVLKYSIGAARRIGGAGDSIVFSGSPRTEYEAFGKNGNGLMAALRRIYGRGNVFVIELKVRPGTSLKRNGARRVCSFCGLPVLASAKGTVCAFCSAKTRRRTLDDPKVIKERLDEYARKTKPMVARMRKQGYKIVQVNGELLPYRIAESIQKKLKLR